MFKRNLRSSSDPLAQSEVKRSALASVIWGDITFRQTGLALSALLVCCLLLLASFAGTTATTATTVDTSHNGLASSPKLRPGPTEPLTALQRSAASCQPLPSFDGY